MSLFLCICVVPADAAITFDFEEGKGFDGSNIAINSFLQFTTLSGGPVRYADISTGFYNAASDDGKSYGTAEYFVSGWVAARVDDSRDTIRVSMLAGPTSYFTVGYSSDCRVVVSIYTADSILIKSQTGVENYSGVGSTGLAYITLNDPSRSIAYATILGLVPQDEDASWWIDNVSCDPAIIPEPSTLITIVCGVFTFIASATRKRYAR